MAAPDLTQRLVVFVQKMGTDDAGYNAVGRPESRLTINAALTDLAANYPPATSTFFHIVAVGPGTFVETGISLPPWTFINGSCDGEGQPTTRISLSAPGIFLSSDWNLNTPARGGLANATIIATSGTPILDFTMPVPLAGNPVRAIEIFNVHHDLTQEIFEATSTNDVWTRELCRQYGVNTDILRQTGGTSRFNSNWSAASATIVDKTSFPAAGNWDAFVITDAASICTANSTAAAGCVLRLSNSSVRNLILSQTAPGALVASADCASVPVRANVTVTGTATLAANFTYLTDARGEGYTPTTPANWAPVPVNVQEALDTLAAAIGTGGVTSITGTANQVLANGITGVPQTGAITLTLPQDIATTSTPQFLRLGLGVAASTTIQLVLGGNSPNAATNSGVEVQTTIRSNTTTLWTGFASKPITQANIFTLANRIHFLAAPQTNGVGSAITTETGFSFVPANFGNANTYAFRSTMNVGTGRFNLYMDGTAANLLGGDLQVNGILTAATGAVLNTPASITLTNGTGLVLTAGAGVTGILPYANGGTGVNAFTNHGVVVAGAAALATVAPGTSGNVLTSNGTDWTSATPSAGAVGANPTASVGLVAVNGVATTFLRSDGAPPLDQSIVPTWTGVHTFSPALRTSGALPYWKLNIPADTGQTAATESIGYQHATGIRAWATTGTVALQRENFFAGPTYASAAASQTFTDAFTAYFTPPIAGTNAIFTRGHSVGIVDATSAATAITGALVIATTLGTAATSVGIGGGNVFAGGSVTGSGQVSSGGNVVATLGLIAGQGNVIIRGPANGVFEFYDGSFLKPLRLTLGGNNNSQPAIVPDAVNGITLASGAGTTTWNDASTAVSGTVANRYIFGIAAPTLTSTNATVTYTVASTLFIGGPPTGTGNVTITAGGAHSILCGGDIVSNNPTAGIGYAVGAGGTVVQATSRTTGVTINKVTGTITTDTTSLAGLASASFTVTNSACAAKDVPKLAIQGGQTNKKTEVNVSAVAAGSFEVTVYNADPVTGETGAIVITFVILKGQTT